MNMKKSFHHEGHKVHEERPWENLKNGVRHLHKQLVFSPDPHFVFFVPFVVKNRLTGDVP
jgi:hypothetical protein